MASLHQSLCRGSVRGVALLTTLEKKRTLCGGGAGSPGHQVPSGSCGQGDLANPKVRTLLPGQLCFPGGFHYFSFPDYFGSWLPWEPSLWKAQASFSSYPCSPSISIPS